MKVDDGKWRHIEVDGEGCGQRRGNKGRCTEMKAHEKRWDQMGEMRFIIGV